MKPIPSTELYTFPFLKIKHYKLRSPFLGYSGISLNQTPPQGGQWRLERMDLRLNSYGKVSI